MILETCEVAEMEQLASAPPPDGSIGALLRAFRHRACLSQEQLAARADLSERTVRNLEAGRVRSPRTHTVRLLADTFTRPISGYSRRSATARAAEPPSDERPHDHTNGFQVRE